MSRPVLLSAALLLALAPASVLAGVSVGVNAMSAVHKPSSGVTIGFPDVCKVPAPATAVPIPYPNLSSASSGTKGSRLRVNTATRGTRVVGMRTVAVTIDEITIGQAVANSGAVLLDLLEQAPRIPERCDGRAKERYLDRLELWSATVYETTALVHDLAVAGKIKAAGSGNPKPFEVASADAVTAVGNANKFVGKSLVAAEAACSDQDPAAYKAAYSAALAPRKGAPKTLAEMIRAAHDKARRIIKNLRA